MENKSTIEKNKDLEELTKVIEGIDFTALKNVIFDILNKTGIDLERLKKVNPESIRIVNDASFESIAAYFQGVDLIGLRAGISDEYDENEILLFVTHEFVHSLSSMQRLEEKYEKYNIISAPETRYKLGLTESLVSDLPFRSFRKNDQVNEGLTELIAEAITVEFLRRKGENCDLSDLSSKLYPVGKDLVKILVFSISEKTGLPDDVVFLSLVRAMFSGEFDAFKLELEDEHSISDLVDRLSKVNEDYQIANVGFLKRKEHYSLKLDKLNIKGLEKVLKRATKQNEYYNPLIEKLK